MLYKAFGKTGKDVSIIGFGGMRFPVKDGEYDMDTCVEMVHEASRVGINYYDTAPYYNNSQSEIIFGEAFKNMPSPFYVSTKSGESDGSIVRRDLETSLKRMGLEKINFFHVWCVLSLEDYKSRMVKGGAYDTLIKAKEEGLIEHICISTHCSGDEIETIVNEGYFDGITLGYNILNFPFRQKGIQAAYRKNMGVVTMNPLSGGLIPSKSDYFEFLKTPEDKDVVDAAVRFNASHKEITVVLTGMDSVEHIRNNAAVCEKFNAFSEEKLKELQDASKASFDSLCTGCQYCEHCPKEISVSKFMYAYNMNILENKDSAKGTMKWHWDIPIEDAQKCIACGICESKCTQHLPIIERLNEMSQW